MTFNIPKELKISYNNESLEQFISNPLHCFKCQKFGYHENICVMCEQYTANVGKEIHITPPIAVNLTAIVEIVVTTIQLDHLK